MMQDQQIVELYWKRDEAAIRETDEKYGGYLLHIARNILFDEEDSRESVNDTYLKAWNSIPPHRPDVLRAFLGKITRQLAIDRYRMRTRNKRGGSEYAYSLSELEECVSGGDVTGRAVDQLVLAEAMERWLRRQRPDTRQIFLERYYYGDSVTEIAARHPFTSSKVKSILHRARLSLREALKQEGFDL